ncbi:hypothetical protein ACFQZI_12840 [Mucilaginibacter lutimaris]|uniref:TonB C-terminal domain-containing protein n=1 Tax=Mucilaginibacter lutimaris TaxID=931629 RepID=A0ABW2ZHV6_9SPHI
MKRTVENKLSDIQQIQKYLNGELDARAMHKLERRAQDDPFLMDALEGYGAARADQKDSLSALQDRLEARTATKVRRMTPWMVTAIAASVIGFAVVIGLLNNNNGNNKQASQVAASQPVKQAAPVDTLPVTIDDKAKQLITPSKKQAIAFNKIHIPAKPFARANADKNVPAAPLQEVTIANASAPNAEPSVSTLEEMVASDMLANKKQDTILGGEFVAINKTPSALKALKSKAEGANMTTRAGKPTDNNPTALANAGLPPNLMAGAVIDRKDALPLPDALGKAPAKTGGSEQSNAYGYAMPAIKKDGESTSNINAFGTKSLKNNDSSLQDKDAQVLREVAIADAQAKKVSGTRPVVGWDNYKKYLHQNAVSADAKVGTVELRATISPGGAITAVTVTKSLSTAADLKAISLVQNGPAWVGKAGDVIIKVEFHK